MLLELTTLSCPLLSLAEAAERARRWVADSPRGATLLGSWRSELGVLGQVLVLRGFPTHDVLLAERRRTLLDADPFHAGELITGLEMETLQPFAFLQPIRTGERGGHYEIRSYQLRPAGLRPTLLGWEAAIRPAQDYTRHLVTAGYALDGPPRIVHIWGFSSLAERAELRRRAYGAGVWPPPGAPQQILSATATIALPNEGSPLR